MSPLPGKGRGEGPVWACGPPSGTDALSSRAAWLPGITPGRGGNRSLTLLRSARGTNPLPLLSAALTGSNPTFWLKGDLLAMLEPPRTHQGAGPRAGRGADPIPQRARRGARPLPAVSRTPGGPGLAVAGAGPTPRTHWPQSFWKKATWEFKKATCR